MPHRDPLYAARLRCAQLRARISELTGARDEDDEPATLATALAEEIRLVTLLSALEGRTPIHPDDECLAFACADDAESPNGEPPDDDPSPKRRWGALAAVGGLGLLTIGAGALLAREPKSHSHPNHSMAVVVARSGSINARPGDRCQIDFHLVPVGECKLEVTCPGVEQHFKNPSCAIGKLGEPVVVHWTGLDFDGFYLRFVDVDANGVSRGMALLQVDEWRE